MVKVTKKKKVVEGTETPAADTDAPKKKTSTSKKVAAKKKRGTKAVRRNAKRIGVKPPQISGEMYNKMYAAYCEQPSVKNVSDTAGCTYDTARYYVNGPAKPEYGMEAIRERFLRAERSRQETEDDVLGQKTEKRLKFVDALMNLAEGEGMLYQQDLAVRMKQYEEDMAIWEAKPEKDRGAPPRPVQRMTLVAVTKVMDKMARMEQYLQGGYDQKIGVSDPTSRFERYSEEELLELAKNGKIPDHDRSANNFQKDN